MAEARRRQILWAAALAALAGLMGAAGPAANATRVADLADKAGDKTATIDVAYDLDFWGFINFGHTNYHAAFDNGAYKATSYFKTSGLVSVFWQAEIDADASGRIGAHTVLPALYDSFARRSAEKKQRVKLTYVKDGPPELFADPTYDTHTYPVPDKEQEDGLDPMSAIALILTGVTADAKNPCGTVAPVYDGRRRYNIELSYMHDQKVTLENKLYQGNVHVCAIKYRQIAGYKPHVMHDDQNWPPIYAYIADIPDAGAPMGRYTVPIKLWSPTKWGTVTAYLATLKTNGIPAKG